jgi:hypothetical protein
VDRASIWLCSQRLDRFASEILVAATVKASVFWVVSPFTSVAAHRRFGESIFFVMTEE